MSASLKNIQPIGFRYDINISEWTNTQVSTPMSRQT